MQAHSTVCTGPLAFVNICLNVIYLFLSYSHTVQYVSDHWENFKTTNQDLSPQTLARLQLEYDYFFQRSTMAILAAQRSVTLGARFENRRLDLGCFERNIAVDHYFTKIFEKDFVLINSSLSKNYLNMPLLRRYN